LRGTLTSADECSSTSRRSRQAGTVSLVYEVVGEVIAIEMRIAPREMVRPGPRPLRADSHAGGRRPGSCVHRGVARLPSQDGSPHRRVICQPDDETIAEAPGLLDDADAVAQGKPGCARFGQAAHEPPPGRHESMREDRTSHEQ
jgi:hypothetical protein